MRSSLLGGAPDFCPPFIDCIVALAVQAPLLRPSCFRRDSFKFNESFVVERGRQAALEERGGRWKLMCCASPHSNACLPKLAPAASAAPHFFKFSRFTRKGGGCAHARCRAPRARVPPRGGFARGGCGQRSALQITRKNGSARGARRAPRGGWTGEGAPPPGAPRPRRGRTVPQHATSAAGARPPLHATSVEAVADS
jgi:hypothetical protein